MQRVAVIGAAGFTGIELCRLLLGHPGVGEILAGVRDPSERLGDLWLRSAPVKIIDPIEAVEPGRADCVFFCTPAGESMKHMRSLAASSVRVVDLSADFRFTDAASYTAAYGHSHVTPDLLPVTYGLPEWNRKEIAASSIVANPGCYAMAILLALIPLANVGLIDADEIIFVAAINGTTGANLTDPHVSHPAMFGNMLPYDLDGHRHVPEIASKLSEMTAQPSPRIDMSTAHGNFARGICALISLVSTAKPSDANEAAVEALSQAYQASQFISVVNDGSPDGLNAKAYKRYAQIASVLRTNRCQLSVHFDRFSHRVKIVSTIDNLGKGAAGNALQSFNLMAGIEETAGLMQYGGW